MISYGRDPYNHDCTIAERVMSARMLEAMEHVWRQCIVPTTNPPDMIYVSAGYYDFFWEVTTKSDLPWYRGREFLPYG